MGLGSGGLHISEIPQSLRNGTSGPFCLLCMVLAVALKCLNLVSWPQNGEPLQCMRVMNTSKAYRFPAVRRFDKLPKKAEPASRQ